MFCEHHCSHMTDSPQLEEYVKQRDLLLRRRDELRRRRQTSPAHVQRHKRQKIETVARTLNTYESSKTLISKYSRLPEMDMGLRLQYARMTCPWMSVVAVKKDRLAPDTGNTTIRCETTLRFDSYGDFVVTLEIDAEGEDVRRLSITPSPDAEEVDEQKAISVLVAESTQTLDVSRLVYGMNTLLRMRHKRKRAWMAIVDELELGKVRAINGFAVGATPSQQRDSLGRLLFDHSPSSVEFELESGKSLRVVWHIFFRPGTRHCVSDFTASVVAAAADTPQDAEGGSSRPVENITRLLKSLIRANDIKLATLQVLNIL